MAERIINRLFLPFLYNISKPDINFPNKVTLVVSFQVKMGRAIRKCKMCPQGDFCLDEMEWNDVVGSFLFYKFFRRYCSNHASISFFSHKQHFPLLYSPVADAGGGGGGWKGAGAPLLGAVPWQRNRPIIVAGAEPRPWRCQLISPGAVRSQEFADLGVCKKVWSNVRSSPLAATAATAACVRVFLRVRGCTILGSVLRLYGPDPHHSSLADRKPARCSVD